MTWISLVCLLALSSSALGRSAYGGGYGTPSLPRVLNMVRENFQRPQGYGQQPSTPEYSAPLVQHDETPLPQVDSYGAKTLMPKTFPTQGGYGGYGGMPLTPQFEQPRVEVILTPADILCRGQAPETVIPIEDGSKFVTCLDESKGVEQACPKGLIYHTSARRCERRLGSPNPCATQPCFNGGQCIPTEYSFQCQCAPGFDGETCELDATVCQTQQPCGGQARCQSFRWGAALKFVCIFQDGEAYGFGSSQLIPNPCLTAGEGPLALSGHQGGFIMCDSERMFVESCPGGTVWDDGSKACVWEGMELGGSQFEQRNFGGYGQSGYGQQKSTGYGQSYSQPRLIHKSTYGGQMTAPRFIQPASYGAQVTVPKQLEGGYGAQVTVPKQLDSGYGAQVTIPKQLDSGYGAQVTAPRFVQPASYGAQVTVPKQLESGYGAQVTIPKQLDSGYGAQVTAPRLIQISAPKQVHGYGSAEIVAPKQISAYGSSIPAPRQIQSSYGSSIPAPRQIQPSYGGQEEQLVTVKHATPY